MQQDLRKAQKRSLTLWHKERRNDNHQGDLEFILEPSVLSSHHKTSSEEHASNEEAWQEDEGLMGMSPLLQAHHAMERMEEFVCKVWEDRWRIILNDVLPDCSR